LQRDVVEQGPDMVIWQVGTNAVWKNRNLGKELDAIVCGLELLRRQPMDIVLMDLQYVPPIITKDKIEKARWMVQAIGDVAKKAGANVFRRFDLMRRWHEVEQIPLECMINPNDRDQLHQNDMSTLRVSNALRDLIVEAVK
jgi:hypothetical protein